MCGAGVGGVVKGVDGMAIGSGTGKGKTRGKGTNRVAGGIRDTNRDPV